MKKHFLSFTLSIASLGMFAAGCSHNHEALSKSESATQPVLGATKEKIFADTDTPGAVAKIFTPYHIEVHNGGVTQIGKRRWNNARCGVSIYYPKNTITKKTADALALMVAAEETLKDGLVSFWPEGMSTLAVGNATELDDMKSYFTFVEGSPPSCGIEAKPFLEMMKKHYGLK